MHRTFVAAMIAACCWVASAEAQYFPREREYGPRFERRSLPPREEPIVRPVLRHHVEPAKTGVKGDAQLCDARDGDPDAAILACGRIIARGPVKGGYSLPVAHVHRGQAYQNKADFEHAIADFSEAIRLKPATAGYLAMRGTAEEKSGGLDAALTDFRLAASLDGKNPEALAGIKRIETRSIAPPSPVTTVNASPPAVFVPSGRGRVALVIGNGAYVNANALPNPPNDAKAMAGMLREIGFDVVEGVNLKRSDMENAFRDFLHKASGASVTLLFYAGHGMQVDGRNYLVPIDAKLAAATDLPFETIEIDKLLDALGDPNHTNIILLDACRDNPLARSFASHLPAARSAAVTSGLAAYSAVGTGTLIAYATAPGQTAQDGQGADSPFTMSLLHNLRTPGLEIRQVLTRVRAEVAKETGNKQIPWDNSSLMGDVVLVGK